MRKIIDKLPFFFLLFSIVLTYWSWFLTKEISAGDWPYYFREMLSEESLIAPLWSSWTLGGVNQNFAFFSYQNFITSLFSNILNVPWEMVYKTFFFGLFIILSSFSITYLVKTVFGKISLLFLSLSMFLYLTNTYILMIVGGGQMGIVLAYSVAPLVLASFIKTAKISYLPEIKNEKLKMKNSLILGLVLALELLFDLRILFITLISALLYFLLNLKAYKNLNQLIIAAFYLFVIPSVITFFLHAYWIIPIFYFKLFSIPAGLTSVSGFNFFSFADFSHALSLLHPNWPENVFGKTYFMKPEFIALPVLAFSALLFITRKKTEQNTEKHRIIFFFVILGLIGSFLAKGVNAPFGEINQWMFLHIPGMNMFRDSTKFYTMVALAYSVLIPFSMNEIYKSLSSKFKLNPSTSVRLQFDFSSTSVRLRSLQALRTRIQNYFALIFLIFAVLFLIFLIRPAVTGQLSGTFQSAQIPKEYKDLNNFVMSQKDYFSTLWIPTQSRFRFQTSNHPLVNANELFKSASVGAIVKRMQDLKTEQQLEKLGVKYVIIPYDSTSEIFLTDRKYDSRKRIQLEKELDKIKWLKKIQNGKITVYETPKHNDKFWLNNQGNISYKNINYQEYKVDIESQGENTLIFSNYFNKYWTASLGNKILSSEKTWDGFNSFKIPKGSSKIRVYFLPQKYMIYSYIFSGFFLVIIVSILIFFKRNKS